MGSGSGSATLFLKIKPLMSQGNGLEVLFQSCDNIKIVGGLKICLKELFQKQQLLPNDCKKHETHCCSLFI